MSLLSHVLFGKPVSTFPGHALTSPHVTRLPDGDCRYGCVFGSRRRMAGGGADTDRQRTIGCALAITAAHRGQPAPDLSALRQLVRDSVSAQRPGAVPPKALLVAAVVTCRSGAPRQRVALLCPLPLRERAAPASPQTQTGEGAGRPPLTRLLLIDSRVALSRKGRGHCCSVALVQTFQRHSRTSTKWPAMAAAAAMAGDTRWVRPL
jgi:hypothetical protein